MPQAYSEDTADAIRDVFNRSLTPWNQAFLDAIDRHAGDACRQIIARHMGQDADPMPLRIEIQVVFDSAKLTAVATYSDYGYRDTNNPVTVQET